MNNFFRNFFGLLLLGLLPFLGLAQPNIDSLKNAAQKAELEKQLEIYIQLGKYYRDVNSDSAIYYANKIIKVGASSPAMLAEGHAMLCVVYRIQNNNAAAIKHGLQAVAYYKQVKDSAGLSAVYSNLGNAYFFNNNLKASLEYQLRALRMKEALNQPNGIASVLVNIGNIYIRQEQFELARDHYKRALDIFIAQKNLMGISYCRNNLGVIAESLGDIELALEEYIEGYKIDEQLGDKIGMTSSFYNIAEAYKKTGRKALAKTYYEKTNSMAREVGDQTRISTSLSNLASLALENGQGKEALRLSDEAVAIANASDYDVLRIDALKVHVQVLSALQRYEEAFNASQRLLEVTKRVDDDNKNKALTEAQAAYEAERKNQEIQLLQKDKSLQEVQLKRQKLTEKVYIGAIFVFIVLLFFIINRYQLIRKNELLLQKMNTSLENKVHERTKALQDALERAEKADKLKTFFLSNLNHELRTPMNGIIGMSEYLQENLADPEKKQLAQSLLDNSKRLSETLSAVIELSGLEASGELLQWQPTDLIAVAKAAIGRYEHEAQLKGLKLEFVHFAGEVILPADEKILSRILDSLLHNAIKFTEKGHIILEVSRQQQGDMRYIDIRVRDTGLGIAKENLEHIFEAFRKGDEVLYRGYEGLGIGLTLARKYTQLLDGQLSVDSEPGRGAQFTIRLHQQPLS